MARRATGQVVERERTRDRYYGLRFRADGQRHYVSLGSASEGWTRKRAEEELQNVLADVRRGIWRPKVTEDVAPTTPRREPTFHEFASEWMAGRRHEGLAERTLEADEWALTHHLLPMFKRHRLGEVTAEEVDRYKRAKLREREEQLVERPLSNRSINATLATLAQVLELAVEYGHLEANSARGRRRRLPTSRGSGIYLEPEQVRALLAGARALDDEDPRRRRYREALLAVLAFAGLRIGELLALQWRDVDLAQSRIHVRRSKTDAGVRTVDVQPELQELLAELKARTRSTGAREFVFPTSTGREDSRGNVRKRVLLRAAELANELLEAERSDCEPLPAELAPHALRRTYASWLVAEGEDPAYVMNQLGHTDPKMTLGLYAKALKSKRRRPHADRPASSMGTGAHSTGLVAQNGDDPRNDETPAVAGASQEWS